MYNMIYILKDQHGAMRNMAKCVFQSEVILRSFLEHMSCSTLPYATQPYTTLPCPSTYLPTSDAGFETGWPPGLEMYARPVLEQIPGLDLPGFCGLGSYDSPYILRNSPKAMIKRFQPLPLKMDIQFNHLIEKHIQKYNAHKWGIIYLPLQNDCQLLQGHAYQLFSVGGTPIPDKSHLLFQEQPMDIATGGGGWQGRVPLVWNSGGMYPRNSDF